MSCSEVMYQAYYPYLYQRAGAAPPVSAHPVPRTGPFSSPFTAAHQYDRVGGICFHFLYLPILQLPVTRNEIRIIITGCATRIGPCSFVGIIFICKYNCHCTQQVSNSTKENIIIKMVKTI